MKKIIGSLTLLSLIVMISLVVKTGSVHALSAIQLNPPEIDKGKPFMQVLKERKSQRDFSAQKLSSQDLSNLLWAANGVNRDDGRRTAPSAQNAQDVDIYVVMEEGIYLYEPKNHVLNPIAAGDYRRYAGSQGFVAAAPVNLVYVSDLSKINWGISEADKITVASLDTGFVAENVALFCASEGMVSVPRLSVDRDALTPILKLHPRQKIVLAHTVGYAKVKEGN